MYEIMKRDGAARIGRLKIGETVTATPSLLLIEHQRFQVGLPGGITLLSLGAVDGKTYLSGNSMDEVQEVHRREKIYGGPREIAAKLVASREHAGYPKALYLPGSCVIRDYAQMVYSGIDLFDASQLIIQAREGQYLTTEGEVPGSEWGKEMCFCPGCAEGSDGFKAILLHNILCALGELSTIRHYISRGQLRHLVEMRIRSNPGSVALQRILDRDHYDFFRKRISFTGGGIVGVSGNILHEPTVQYYHEKMKEYRKPGGEILILLPCSARKPYSTSKSHRLFHTVTTEYQGIVHEVIITSPLGLVPRELENFYPASDYDISVTGEWSLEEKEMIRNMLSSFLENNSYSAVINHTPYAFVSDFLDGLNIGEGKESVTGAVKDTIKDGRATSSESLHNLREELETVSATTGVMSPELWKKGSFENMWKYQFGPASDSILHGTKVRGRFPFFKLFSEDGQLAMMVPGSRRISLTLNGAGLLGELKMNRVFIEDFHPTGDIFAVGITGADNGIRMGDEVAVFFQVKKDTEMELRGAGVAVMNSEEMMESKRGVGVRLRHKVKKHQNCGE